MRFRQSPDENAAVWFIVIGSTLSLICLSWWISGNRSYRKGWNDAYSSFKPDTVYRDTTIYDIKPVPVEVTPAGKEMHPVGTVAQLKKVIDSLAAVKPDTTLIEIPVPLETKVYRDEKDSTYEAKVTGYKASLDWVKVNQKTAYINVPIPTPVWPTFIVSPALNVEILPRSVFAGAGVVADYWSGRLQISLEVGYGVNNILGAETATGTETYMSGAHFGLYGKGVVKYNLIRR